METSEGSSVRNTSVLISLLGEIVVSSDGPIHTLSISIPSMKDIFQKIFPGRVCLHDCKHAFFT